MSMLDNIKQIVTPPEFLCEFDLKRKYSLRDKYITGKIKMLARKEMTLERVDFTIEETIKQPKKPGEKKRKSLVETISRKKQPWPWELEKFKEETIEFSLTINPKKKRKKEQQSYSWDMALMDRVHDQAKKTVFTYKIHAKITFAGEKKPHSITKTLRIE